MGRYPKFSKRFSHHQTSVVKKHRVKSTNLDPNPGANMSIIWTIIIGFVAGIVAKFLHPGSSNEPSGFILTAALGIAGSFVATYLGQALGWYRAGEGAGFIGAVVGAIIVLAVWGFLAPKLQKTT
jgi:uncharacterized membrane protein YeaQ/YmgE (transglycosylase-associated protein family)